MHTERDRFLTEALGLCWHEFPTPINNFAPPCSKCNGSPLKLNILFSSWHGFGILWEWASKKEWWQKFGDFIYSKYYNGDLDITICMLEYFINPDKFADVIYEFLNKED